MEGNKKPHTGLLNMILEGGGAASQPPCAYIPARQAASSAYPTDDVPEGARLRGDTSQHRGPLSRHETMVMWPGTSLGQPALQS